MNIQLRPILTHTLAMVIAALLALAFAGCGGDGTTTTYAPRSASATHNAQPVVTTSGEENSTESDAGVDADATVDAADAQLPEPAVESSAPAPAPTVRRSSMALAIEEREPVDAADSYAFYEFEESGRIYAHYSLRNDSDQEAAAIVTFVSPRGVSYGQVRLTVPANVRRWRTWAFTRAVRNGPEGTWEARLSSEDGELLDTQSFDLLDE